MTSDSAQSANPLAALITGIFLTVCCNPVVGIVMIVLAAMALNKTDDSRAEARLTRAAWIAFGVGVGITLVIAATAFLLGLVPGMETYL
ncbi:hypothetical protein [Nocardiopsis sp. NRRL B-16309]|uniref:hypothetical protein n=1 Tax=Nocardiopsis sp. NRRL B-16309 TaxID=1519494 RepID=UPI0006AFE758|nr:hypothetical protein [Nocardiopsis sp. NRRL B-16309]KOX11312.1 hypothetical protein ADL05_24145 [Nocardiopsis sp. NRRL B-16309]